MIHGPGCFFCMTSGRGLIHPLEWNTLCPFIARRNGHRLRQMRCKGKLISWSCLSCPYFLFLPLDLTWSRCCAALLAKFSEDSFFHVVTASEKACSTPSGCRWFGKGCDWRQSSFFETWSFHIWIKIDLKAELSIRLYIITINLVFCHAMFFLSFGKTDKNGLSSSEKSTVYPCKPSKKVRSKNPWQV